MSRIDDLLADGPTLSFEFFPPKTPEGDATLRRTLTDLEELHPSFVSVTYGAGGSTRDKTEAWVRDIRAGTSMVPMPHLTAVCHTRPELKDILARHRDAGFDNVLALRGDPPRDIDDPFWEVEHAIDLVELAREIGGDTVAIGVAAHPEGHPLSDDLSRDRRHLAAKLTAADFGITQFFFRLQDYLRMVEDLAGLGCDTPVIAGVIPVTNVRQIKRFADLSGAGFPTELADRLHAVEDDEEEVRRIGVEVATKLCQDLLDVGAPGLHIYTLNRSQASLEMCANLGLGAR